MNWLELNQRANRVAHSLCEAGTQKGDCVSLFMQNRIEYIICMLGVQKLGAIVGMINTNLIKKQLTHCVNLVASQRCIFGEELTQPLNEIRKQLSLEDGKDFLFVRDQVVNPYRIGRLH